MFFVYCKGLGFEIILSLIVPLVSFMVLQIWEDIKSGRAEEDSSLLSRFLVVSYADLKKWTFTYRFSFPGLRMWPQATAASCQAACDFFTTDEVTYLHGLNLQTYYLRTISACCSSSSLIRFSMFNGLC